MSNGRSRPGLVDFLDPEFLHALGIAVATFAVVEVLLKNVYFRAKHGHDDYAKETATVLEIQDCKFNERIDKVFAVLRRKVQDFDGRGFNLLQQDFHRVRIVRNFVVHGTWKKSGQDGFYKLLHIDDAGRVMTDLISKEHLLSTAAHADNLMVELKSLLVAEGLMPPTGPRIEAGP